MYTNETSTATKYPFDMICTYFMNVYENKQEELTSNFMLKEGFTTEVVQWKHLPGVSSTLQHLTIYLGYHLRRQKDYL